MNRSSCGVFFRNRSIVEVLKYNDVVDDLVPVYCIKPSLGFQFSRFKVDRWISR